MRIAISLYLFKNDKLYVDYDFELILYGYHPQIRVTS